MIDDEEGSPLDCAVEEDHYDIALYLVNHGCVVNRNKERLLLSACQYGELDVVKELIEKYKVDPKGKIIITLLTVMLVAFSYVYTVFLVMKFALAQTYFPVGQN